MPKADWQVMTLVPRPTLEAELEIEQAEKQKAATLAVAPAADESDTPSDENPMHRPA